MKTKPRWPLHAALGLLSGLAASWLMDRAIAAATRLARETPTSEGATEAPPNAGPATRLMTMERSELARLLRSNHGGMLAAFAAAGLRRLRRPPAFFGGFAIGTALWLVGDAMSTSAPGKSPSAHMMTGLALQSGLRALRGV